MYIIKNAFKCISRSKGRNVLIGIIALVIAISACIGLSIRQAAISAKETALSGMSINATISFNRMDAIEGLGGIPGGKFDREEFENMIGSTEALTLDEYLKYAEAASVDDFYYTLTVYFNGNDEFLPVSNSSGSSSGSGLDFSGIPGMGGGMGFPGGRGSEGDFTVVGVSTDSAMTDFFDGTSSIYSGEVFEEGTSDYVCIISYELASYNSLNVGDKIVFANVDNEEETYEVEISGIYKSTANNEFSMSWGGSNDPANKIYMSAAAVSAIVDASKEANTTDGEIAETALEGNLLATYVLADIEAYEAFSEEVKALGLDDKYTVSSNDLTDFEKSLEPLNTLSSMAGWFLIIILIIGGIILVVLNIFNVRERKYEIGVLTAMGMKKWKVAAQFICEILVVTMIAVILGAAVGAVSSVPITNALLNSQLVSKNNMQNQINDNFGRPSMGGGFGGGMPSFGGGSMPDMGSGMPDFGNGSMQNIIGGASDYITEIDSAMNLTVVFQMIGVGLLLTLIASAASVLFVMRYDPLKILSNRD